MSSLDDEPFDYMHSAPASRDQSNKVAGVKKETGYCDVNLAIWRLLLKRLVEIKVEWKL
jgi:hypothetical protein